MKVSQCVVSALFLFTLIFSQVAEAQYRSAFSPVPPPSVLSPDPSHWWIGPQIGANLNTHSGDFVTDYCQCGFEDGSGTGLGLGVELGHFLSSSFAVAVKLVYDDLRGDYSYMITLPTADQSGGIIDLEYERQNAIVLSYLMVNPVLQFHPVNGFYLFAGPAIGVTGTSTQEYTLRLADENYEFVIGDPTTRLVEEDSGEIPRAESLRADVRAGIGANIRMGRGISFSPEVSYALPLTRISDDDNWEASALRLMGIFKFEL